MAVSTASIPPGEGTPLDFQPRLPPKEVVHALREMLGQLVNADAKDKTEGKPANANRARFRDALQHAIHLANAARFTGEVPPHWHPKGGSQQHLTLTLPPEKAAG